VARSLSTIAPSCWASSLLSFTAQNSAAENGFSSLEAVGVGVRIRTSRLIASDPVIIKTIMIAGHNCNADRMMYA
jgi:hypothetical protein